MATQPEDLIDDNEDEIEQLSEAANDQDDAEQGDDQGQPDDQADDSEEDVIQFAGAETKGEVESEGMRSLRERLKESERERKELLRKVAPKVDEVGPEPNIDDYWENPEQYTIDLRAYDAKMADAKAAEKRQAEANEAAQKKWQDQERTFEDAWSGLRNEAKHAARAKVEDAFAPEQQAMLVKAARGNGAGLFFMLGSNPDSLAKLKDLASDPVEFIAEAATMAKDIQVTKRAPRTLPEAVHRGSGGSAGNTDAKLIRLQSEAEKTNDYTKLFAYKRELRAAGKNV
jgi:hypothetical protein